MNQPQRLCNKDISLPAWRRDYGSERVHRALSSFHYPIRYELCFHYLATAKKTPIQENDVFFYAQKVTLIFTVTTDNSYCSDLFMVSDGSTMSLSTWDTSILHLVLSALNLCILDAGIFKSNIYHLIVFQSKCWYVIEFQVLAFTA